MMLMMAYGMGAEIRSAECSYQAHPSMASDAQFVCFHVCFRCSLFACCGSLAPRTKPPDHCHPLLMISIWPTSLPETSEWMTISVREHVVIMKISQGLGLHPCLFRSLLSHHLQNTGHLRLHVCWEMDDVCLYFDRTHIQSLGIQGCNNSWGRIIQL